MVNTIDKQGLTRITTFWFRSRQKDGSNKLERGIPRPVFVSNAYFNVFPREFYFEPVTASLRKRIPTASEIQKKQSYTGLIVEKRDSENGKTEVINFR